jgi:predicted ArsR family transcriptional regulator
VSRKEVLGMLQQQDQHHPLKKHYRKYHIWTKEEIEFLQKHWQHMSLKEMAQNLNVSTRAVWHKLREIQQAKKQGTVLIKSKFIRNNIDNNTFTERVFLYFLHRMAYECKRIGKKPDVSTFLEEYRKYKSDLEISPVAEKIRKQMKVSQ